MPLPATHASSTPAPVAQAEAPGRAVPGGSRFGLAARRAGIRPGAASCVVALIGVLDLLLARQVSLSFTGWTLPVLATVGLLGLAAFYRVVRPVPALAELPRYAACWILFSIVGVVATYYAAACAAAMGRPLQDAGLAAFDAAAGFDWVAWTEAVRARPALNAVLEVAYGSLMPQVIGTLVLLALTRVRGRNEELLLAAALSLLPLIAVSALVPALGPWAHFAAATPAMPDGAGGATLAAYVPPGATGVPHVLGIRDGSWRAFDLARAEGIISFPSYHTVLALLLVHAHRGLRWSLPPVAALNGLMLLSVPSEGAHYLADMVAGAAVAVLTLMVVRAARSA